MARKTLPLFFILSLTIISGCGGNMPLVTGNTQPHATPTPIPLATPVPTPAANQYFNMSMIGQTWTFVNGYGDPTVIEVKAAPIGSQAQVVWHYLPKPLNPDGTVNCRPYWNPGDCSSELQFGMTQNQDGSWSATQFLATCDSCITGNTKGSATIQPTATGGYLVIPPAQSSFTTGNTGYVPCWQLGVLSWIPDNCNIIGATPIPWLTNGFIDNVSTPLYSGPALVSEQFENCPKFCVSERWYFAPNLGLVQVVQTQNGSMPFDPLITIQRTK